MNFSKDKLEALANELNEQFNKIQDILDNVKNQQKLLEKSGEWEGPSAKYYNDKFLSVINCFDTVNDSMSSSLKYLQSVIEYYSSLDKQIIMKASLNFKIKK